MRVVSGPAAVQAATTAPQATQTVATAAAPKPRTPAPARPAGGAPAPARRETPAAPARREVLAPVKPGAPERNAAFLQDRAAARAEYEKGRDKDFLKRLERVEQLRSAGELGPRSRLEQAAIQTLSPRMTSEFSFGYDPNTADADRRLRGVQRQAYAIGGRSTEFIPGEVEAPTSGVGGTLDSVSAFRKKAEELGLGYAKALRDVELGKKELARAPLENREFSRSAGLQKLQEAQRERVQKLVNARESLRQFGYTDEEMQDKFGG